MRKSKRPALSCEMSVLICVKSKHGGWSGMIRWIADVDLQQANFTCPFVCCKLPKCQAYRIFKNSIDVWPLLSFGIGVGYLFDVELTKVLCVAYFYVWLGRCQRKWFACVMCGLLSCRVEHEGMKCGYLAWDFSKLPKSQRYRTLNCKLLEPNTVPIVIYWSPNVWCQVPVLLYFEL